MTIRWKLNLVVITLITIFLVTSGFAMRAVRENATSAHIHTRMRELSELTSSIHTGIYRHLAASRGAIETPDLADPEGWLRYAVRDIEIQTRLAENDEERELWSHLRRAVTALGRLDADSPGNLSMSDAVGVAERNIRALRSRYRLAEYAAIEMTREKDLRTRQAIWIAGSLTLLLLLVYVMMVRNWLVKPVELLKSAADEFGAGKLEHVVPLHGRDELAQLARRLEAMAARLAAHQAALLKAHELSVVGKLCTNVADGLRNPLSALRAGLHADKLRGATSEQLAAIIRACMRQTDRMEERIAKLLEFSEPRELRLETATFRQVALTAQAHALPLLKERNVKLMIDDHSGDSTWSVDRDEFADALAELINNAARRSAAGSEVVLRASVLSPPVKGDSLLQVQVVDQGGGMTSAEVGKAFDPFFTSRPDGTGMGLAIVRRTVEKHGGEITLASEVGKGTTVTMTLPMQPVSIV